MKDRSLRANDFAFRQLPSGPPGATGLTGPAGPQGQSGTQGVPGVVGKVTVHRIDFSIQDGEETGVNVKCPLGTRAIGGGSSLDASEVEDVNLTVSRPFRTVGDPPAIGDTFNGWRIVYANPLRGTGHTVGHAFAVCAED